MIEMKEKIKIKINAATLFLADYLFHNVVLIKKQTA
jgi:hypothetical protein